MNTAAAIARITEAKDHFELFQLPKPERDPLGEAVWDVPPDRVRREYRLLALHIHPDKTSEPEAVEAFEVLKQAFGVLSDPDKRDQYVKTYVEKDITNRIRGWAPGEADDVGGKMASDMKAREKAMSRQKEQALKLQEEVLRQREEKRRLVERKKQIRAERDAQQRAKRGPDSSDPDQSSDNDAGPTTRRHGADEKSMPGPQRPVSKETGHGSASKTSPRSRHRADEESRPGPQRPVSKEMGRGGESQNRSNRDRDRDSSRSRHGADEDSFTGPQRPMSKEAGERENSAGRSEKNWDRSGREEWRARGPQRPDSKEAGAGGNSTGRFDNGWDRSGREERRDRSREDTNDDRSGRAAREGKYRETGDGERLKDRANRSDSDRVRSKLSDRCHKHRSLTPDDDGERSRPLHVDDRHTERSRKRSPDRKRPRAADHDDDRRRSYDRAETYGRVSKEEGDVVSRNGVSGKLNSGGRAGPDARDRGYASREERDSEEVDSGGSALQAALAKKKKRQGMHRLF